MTRTTATLLAVCLLLCTGALQAAATLESFKFSSTQEEQRFKDLIVELRCLVCQNQSLLDSDAELAHDLRAEVYGMMQTEKSDDEITSFLVTRYGDFVLYSPPVKPSTWLIWFGPFVLLLLALFVLFRALRRQQATTEHEISGEDRRRIEQALHDNAGEDSRS